MDKKDLEWLENGVFALHGKDAAEYGRRFLMESNDITSEEIDAWEEAHDLIRRSGLDNSITVPVETYKVYETVSRKLGIL